MEEISLKAAELQKEFDAFRDRQVEGDGSVPVENKEVVRERLADLDNELNHYLAGNYGVKSLKKTVYAKWLKSHQPFHWFVEFYRIVHEGGFDVIIGNPPYVEYKDIKKTYEVSGFRSEQCGDLYSFCTERSLALLRARGWLGLILPISIFGTDGFAPLQKLVLNSVDSAWVSCYANRPSQLFDGAQKRLTILVARRFTPKDATIFTTQYLRWRRAAFQNVFQSRIEYAPGHSNFSVFPAALEKLGSRLEVQAFSRLTATVERERLANAVTVATRYRVYYTRKFGYFLAFLDFVPEIIDVITGRRVPPSELKELGFASAESVSAVVALLSSSTFFWFWNVLSDCRNLNRRDLLAFPLNPERVHPELRQAFVALGERYLRELKGTSHRMCKGNLKIETFKYAECKPIVDEIDLVLARHFGFTEEELDFIINYDITYRTSAALE